jgi:TPR repeat protein
MKSVIAGCVLLFATLTFAQSSDDAQATYQALVKAENALHSFLRMAPLGKPQPGYVEPSENPLKKVMELEEALKALYEANAPSGDFYWGTYQLEQGQALVREPDMAREHFEKAVMPLRRAASGGEPAAAWNLGLMFANGWGVHVSKLAASEWYVRAGEGYAKNGDRDAALASLERAEGLDPRSIGAKRLRTKLSLR